MTPLPAFYDDLDAARAELWRLLEAGPRTARNAFHTPALATVDAHGLAQVRTVVLRAVDPDAGTLRFHCDRRSRKAAEIAATGRAALHVYDAAAKVQLRVGGRARLHADDALADAAWAGAMAMSRVGYGIAPAPGAIIADGAAYALPDEASAPTLGRPNFAAVVVRAERLEFLYLDRRGHRRAAWARDGAGWAGAWLAP